MAKYNVLEVIKTILESPQLKFKAVIDGNEVIEFYNQNGGISIGNDNLRMSKKIIHSEWELLHKRYTFMEAVNSNQKIKHEGWDTFKPIQEALYDLLDYKKDNVVQLINGYWNIEGDGNG